MGAIAGIVFSELYQAGSFVDNMLLMMEHRGLSPKELHTYRNFQIGASGQKMGINEARTVVAILDGVITNAAEIKKKLKLEKISAEPEDFAQLLVYAYEEWGIKFTEEIAGNFAIAILDHRKQQLWLVRDRVGQSPLYWFHDGRHFIFSSELKGLLGSGLISNAVAPDAIGAYLTFGYIPQDMTPITKVNKLLPGFYLKFDGTSKSVSIDSYWSYSKLLSQKKSEDTKDLIKQLDHALSDAVRVRIPSKKQKLGLFLSGSMGSTTIGHYLQKIEGSSDINSYTACFQGEDELIHEVGGIAKQLKIKHEVEIINRENFLDDFVKMIWYLDEPLADPNILLTWKLAAMASGENNSIIYSGTGGNALFFGSAKEFSEDEDEEENAFDYVEKMRFKVLNFLKPILGWIHPKILYQNLREVQAHPWLSEYLQTQMIFDQKELTEVSPQYAQYFTTNVFINKFHHLSRIKSRLLIPQYFDFKTQLVDSIVLQLDRFSNAHQLKWTAPLFCTNVMETLAQFPYPEKGRTKAVSQFIHSFLQDLYPEGLSPLAIRKSSNPLKLWIENTELHSLFELLINGTLVETGIISGKWLQRQLLSPQSRASAFTQLWSILVLEVWFRLYVQEPLKPQVPTMSILSLLTSK